MKRCSRDGCAVTIDGDAKYCTAVCRDHAIDRPHCVGCVDQGVADERAAIVAWLRSWMGEGAELLKELSADIERGAHIPLSSMRPIEPEKK